MTALRQDKTARAARDTSGGTSPKQWMIDVNARDQKVVDLVMSLATAAIVIPALFLKTYLGVQDEPLAIFLDWPVYVAWALLFGTLSLGIVFHYLSSRWVKLAWGREEWFREDTLTLWMALTFWATILSLPAGLVFLVMFLYGA